jgi:hypothetical protein
METVTFQCDFCGMKSEEESTMWRRPRCSVELVLRGHRFSMVTISHSLYGVPFSGPEVEDQRLAASLCDRCMKRISALFGLDLESPEEARWREAQLAQRVAAEAARTGSVKTGMRGEMIDQFPTPDGPLGASPYTPAAPVKVVHFTTPKSTMNTAGAYAAPDSSAEGAAPGTLEKTDEKTGDGDAGSEAAADGD